MSERTEDSRHATMSDAGRDLMVAPVRPVAEPTAREQLQPLGEARPSFARSLAWTAFGKWAAQGAIWISTIIVARELQPSDFGLVAMAGVFIGLVGVASEMGIGSAVVMLRGLNDEQVAQVHGLAMLVGCAAFVLAVMASAPVATFFGAPALRVVIPALAITFIMSGARSVPSALLQRNFEFRRLTIIDTAAAGVSAATAASLALAGLGLWALVFGQIVGAAATSALTLRHSGQRMAYPRRADLGPVLQFSRRILVAGLAWYAYTNADVIVAGKMLGAVSAGIYTFGWIIINLPAEKLATLVTGLTPSFFSQVQGDNQELRRILRTATETIAVVALPATAGIAVVAGDFIPLAFGAKWAPAIPVIQILAVFCLLRALRPVQNNALLAVGDTRFAMWLAVVSAIVYPLAFLVGSQRGPTGIALAWAALYPLFFWISLRRLSHVGIISVREYLSALWPSISATGFMVAMVAGSRALLGPGPGALARVMVQVVVGAAAFVAFMLMVHGDRVRDLLNNIRTTRQ